MVQIRKHYSPTFKAQVVQEVLAGDKSLGQIAAQYGIHPNMISKWKRAALQAMPTAFDEESQFQAQAQISALKAQHEKEKDANLYLQWLDSHPHQQQFSYISWC